MARSRVSVAVLAGGRSTRMGRDKAWIDVEGEPLVRRVVRRLEPASDDLFVVVKSTDPFEEAGLTAVADEVELSTPLAGIITALRAARHPLCFVCAVDMPLVDPHAVERLVELADGHDAVVPVRDGRPEPLHAVWRTGAADAIAAALDAGVRAVRDLLDRLDVRRVPPDEWRAWAGRSMTNVNTPEDLERFVARGSGDPMVEPTREDG